MGIPPRKTVTLGAAPNVTVLASWAGLAVALALGACAGPEDRGRWSTWSSYAGSADSAQFSSLAQIHRGNVQELEVAWTYPTGSTSHRGTPLVIDDVMYVVANGGVTALVAATGEVLWFSPDSVAPRVRGFVSVQNLTDRTYIAARRPAGARPALPRTFMAGLNRIWGRKVGSTSNWLPAASAASASSANHPSASPS